VEKLQVPLSDKQSFSSSKTSNNLKQADVLGAQTSVSQPDLTSELPKHNMPQDCWVEYSGKFYDITVMISMDATLPDYCGKDATEVFDPKSKSKLSSVDVRDMLAQFLIQ